MSLRPKTGTSRSPRTTEREATAPRKGRKMRGATLMLVAFVMAAMAVVVPVGEQPTAQASWKNDDSTRINVYNFNINRMDRKWRKWVDYIDGRTMPRPDIILLQDVDTVDERKNFQNYLGQTWGGTWYGRAGAMGSNGWHTAVVWRSERLNHVKSRGWWGWGDPDKGDPDDDHVEECQDQDDNSIEEENGAPAVQVVLYDKIAKRYVSAVSFKTPGASPDWCPWRNTRKVNWKLNQDGWSGRVLVMGTDANSRDRDGDQWRCWYAGTNGDLGEQGCNDEEGGGNGYPNTGNQGFRDPIYDYCDQETTSPSALRTCLEDHGTHSDRDGHWHRIDFIFTKLGNGNMPQTSHRWTLPIGPANCSNKDDNPSTDCYSDHRSIRSMIYY